MRADADADADDAGLLKPASHQVRIGLRYADRGFIAARKRKRGNPRKGRAFPHSRRRSRSDLQTQEYVTRTRGAQRVRAVKYEGEGRLQGRADCGAMTVVLSDHRSLL